MSTDKKLQPYDIVVEAETFVNQLDSDELVIAPEADGWSVEGNYWRETRSEKSVPNALAITISDFKRFKDLYLRVNTFSSTVAELAKPRLSGEVLTLAQEIVAAKNMLKNHRLLNPGKRVFAELENLREQIKQEKILREKAERRAKEAEKSESEINIAYDEVKKQFDSITGKIKQDFGEENGEKWITKALAFDSTIIESEVDGIDPEDGRSV
jgi:hypothetical protein